MHFFLVAPPAPNHKLIIPRLRSHCMSCDRWRDACVCPLTPRIWVYSFHALDDSLPPRSPPTFSHLSLLPSYYTLSARSEALWDGVREWETEGKRARQPMLGISFCPFPHTRTKNLHAIFWGASHNFPSSESASSVKVGWSKVLRHDMCAGLRMCSGKVLFLCKWNSPVNRSHESPASWQGKVN